MNFEKVYQVGVSGVNSRLSMTNSALISLLQDTAAFFADGNGQGILDVSRTGLTWFIIDWKVKIFKRPKYGDEVRVLSWGRDAKECFLYNDFKIFRDKEVLAVATAKMALFNIKTRTLEKISDELALTLEDTNLGSVFEERTLEHMKVLDRYEDSREITIRASDLDFNGHVNNVKYFDFLKELNAEDFSEPDEFRITYRKEIKKDEKISVYHSRIEKKDCFVIKNDSGEVKAIIEHKCQRRLKAS